MKSFLIRAGQWLYGQAYLLLSLTMFFWASNGVLGRYVAGHVPPVALAWTRWTLAVIILLPFAWPHLKRDLPEFRRHFPLMLLLSFAGITCYNTMAYIGLQYTEAVNGALMQSTAPLLIALWSFVIFGDRLTGRQAAGIFISLSGVVVIVTRADWQALVDLTINIGDIWIVGALACYGLYSALLRLRPRVHWMSFIIATFFLGDLMLTPVLIWEISTGYVLQFDATTILSIAAVTIFASILAYICFNRGVELIGANRAGPFFHLIPLFGVVLAMVFLGERPQLFHGIGFAAILTGIVMATRSQAGAARQDFSRST